VEENWEEHHHKNEILITNETIQHEETKKTKQNKLGRGEGGRFYFCLFFSWVGGGGVRVGLSERAIHSRWNQ